MRIPAAKKTRCRARVRSSSPDIRHLCRISPCRLTAYRSDLNISKKPARSGLTASRRLSVLFCPAFGPPKLTRIVSGFTVPPCSRPPVRSGNAASIASAASKPPHTMRISSEQPCLFSIASRIPADIAVPCKSPRQHFRTFQIIVIRINRTAASFLTAEKSTAGHSCLHEPHRQRSGISNHCGDAASAQTGLPFFSRIKSPPDKTCPRKLPLCTSRTAWQPQTGQASPSGSAAFSAVRSRHRARRPLAQSQNRITDKIPSDHPAADSRAFRPPCDV